MVLKHDLDYNLLLGPLWVDDMMAFPYNFLGKILFYHEGESYSVM
jgi:hypothetical protein